MSLNNYGFVDNVYMKSKTFDVSVSSKDKIIQVMDGNVLLASLSMALNNNILSLIGKDNAVVAEVELPQSKLIKNIIYNDETKQIIIEIIMEDGSESEIVIDVPDLVTIYEGCNGIEVDGNKIGIKINENSSQYLLADDSGLAINIDYLDETFATDESLKKYATLDELDNYATKNELDNYAQKTDLDEKADRTDIVDMATQTWVKEQGYLTEQQDISNLATKDDLLTKVDWINIPTETYPNRKSIILNNHDTILGKDTSGNTRNLIMLSVWDKVDIGTSQLPINLNTPQGIRPTIQEYGQTGESAFKMAYLKDIDDFKIENNVYINTLLEDYSKIDHNHDDVYSKLDHNHNELYAPIDHNHDDVYSKLDHKHDELYAPINHNHDELYASIDHNHDELYASIDHNHDDVYSKLDHKHDSLYSNIDHNHDDVYSNIDHNHDDVYSKLDHNHDDVYSKLDHNHDSLYSNIDHKHNEYLTSANIANKVDWNEYEYNALQRKSIILDLYDAILSKNQYGQMVNIAMVSKFGTIDIGSPIIPVNFNTPQGVRPTVQEGGKTLEEANQIAYVSDIIDLQSDVNDNFNNYVTKTQHTDDLGLKQDILTSGKNISIENNVISCTIDETLFVVVDGNLPNKGEPNKIYLVSNLDGSENNQLIEYYYTDNIGWEKIGEYKEDIDLTPYLTKEQWDSEIPTCVNDKFKLYSTQSDVEKLVNNGIAQVINQSKEYTDTQVIDVKNFCKTEINNSNEAQNQVIASNSDRLSSLESRCDHFDELFAQLIPEHGDGTIGLNVYTKTECDLKFATKSEMNSKVDWIEYDYTQPINSTPQSTLTIDKIAELEKTIEELQNKINNLEQLLTNKGN